MLRFREFEERRNRYYSNESERKNKMKKNIVLIGMPGSGKSTIGVLLAKAINYHFIDGDLLIQRQEGKTLVDIINEKGIDEFLSIENQVLRDINTEASVIATG